MRISSLCIIFLLAFNCNAESESEFAESEILDKPIEEVAEDASIEIKTENEEETNATLEAEKVPKTSLKKVSCLPLKGANFSSSEENEVEILNGTSLMSRLTEQVNNNVTNRTTPAICSMVMFYATWCPFSARAGPHFNALARHFPDLVFIAADANRHSSFTNQFGVLALPTLLLFHNGKTIIKFNYSDFELANFTAFVTTFTGLEPIGDPALTEADHFGPMPTIMIEETDMLLHLSWIFVALCAVGYFGKSPFCLQIIESIRNNWREAEIQHEHND